MKLEEEAGLVQAEAAVATASPAAAAINSRLTTRTPRAALAATTTLHLPLHFPARMVRKVYGGCWRKAKELEVVVEVVEEEVVVEVVVEGVVVAVVESGVGVGVIKS